MPVSAWQKIDISSVMLFVLDQVVFLGHCGFFKIKLEEYDRAQSRLTFFSFQTVKVVLTVLTNGTDFLKTKNCLYSNQNMTTNSQDDAVDL